MAVAAGVLAYNWVNSYAASSTTPPAQLKPLRIEALGVLYDEVLEITYGLELSVYNPNPEGQVIDSIYILKGGELVAHGIPATPSRKVVIDGKSVATFKAVFDANLEPATYVVKLSSEAGSIGVNSFVVHYKAWRSIIVNVTTSNDASSPVEDSTFFARSVVWVEDLGGGQYKVHNRVYAAQGYTIYKVRHECFASDGQYPDWVGAEWAVWRYGDDPWEDPYTYPDYAAAYWTPVREDEFPVVVIATVVYEPS